VGQGDPRHPGRLRLPEPDPPFRGRALFISNGDQDPNCPIEGARIAIKAAEDAFAKSGDKEKLEIHVGEKVGHTVTPEHRKAAIAFCAKWLKK